MKTKSLLIVLLSLLVASAAWSQDVSMQKAAQLFQQFLPQPARADLAYGNWLDSIQDPLQQMQLHQDSHDGLLNYLSFQMPGDPAQYVLLAWGDSPVPDTALFRLLKSQDGGHTYTVAQDFPNWYGPFRNGGWTIRLHDVTSNGVPDLLLESDNVSLFVFAWHDGQFTSITPTKETDPGPGPATILTAFSSNGGVGLAPEPGGGPAEVVVHGWTENVPDPGSTDSYHIEYSGLTKIYRYNGSQYVLWKELPPDDQYPVTVPALAVVHPGTIPLSELEAQADSKKASGKGNSDLQIFVGHPAGDNSVDDMVTNTFAYQGTPLTFKKRWPNQKQPDMSSANWQWEGCPVKQTKASGSGEWNPSPEDPYLPSPDGVTEFHFVGPYLEFRLPRSAVYPMLLSQATADFAKDPSRQTDYISIPISGMLKNQKYVAVNALVCVKNTAAAHSAAGEKSRVQDSEKKDSAPKK